MGSLLKCKRYDFEWYGCFRILLSIIYLFFKVLSKPTAIIKFLIFTTLFFRALLPVYAQGSEKVLVQIRERFRDINSNIDRYRKVAFRDIVLNKEPHQGPYSMEGEGFYRLEKVNMTKIFDGDQLVKITVEFFGDREELTSDYYVRHGELFFVDKIKTVYHKPKWHDAFKATERSIEKNRFYFKDKELVKWVRWIETELKSVGKMDPSYKGQESKILNDYSLYMNIK